MRHQFWKPLVLAAAAFSLSAMVPIAASAQDHPDEHHEQKPDDHGTMMRRDDHHEDAHSDPVAQYRHDHPHSSARCHDGFFTSTHDRSRACTKHGGIDVWLSL